MKMRPVFRIHDYNVWLDYFAKNGRMYSDLYGCASEQHDEKTGMTTVSTQVNLRQENSTSTRINFRQECSTFVRHDILTVGQNLFFHSRRDDNDFITDGFFGRYSFYMSNGQRMLRTQFNPGADLYFKTREERAERKHLEVVKYIAEVGFNSVLDKIAERENNPFFISASCLFCRGTPVSISTCPSTKRDE